MIEIKNLTKKFGSLVAVNNLSVTFKDGITGLVGENGAGKSTLFRLISDVLEQDDGLIIIDDAIKNNIEIKEKVFFLTDNPYFPRRANAKKIVDFYSTYIKLNRDNFYSLLEKFSINKDENVEKFSKGMRRRLFLALAFSCDAKYLLLDEALDGLDPLMVEQVKTECLNLVKQGKNIIISSHNIQSLESLVDNFVLLYKGKLAKNGDIEDLSSNIIKYQILCNEILDLEKIKELGLDVLSLSKLGSLYHVVIKDKVNSENILKNAFNAQICEQIPLDNNEILKLALFEAREEK